MRTLWARFAVLMTAWAIHHSAQAVEEFPPSRDVETLAQWLSARSQIPLEAVVLPGPEVISAVLPLGGLAAVALGRRVRVVQEVVDPNFVSTMGGRSAVLDLEVDCTRRRLMRQAFDLYAGPNMTGSTQHLGPTTAWSDPAEPGSPMSVVIAAACDPDSVSRPMAAYRLAAVKRAPDKLPATLAQAQTPGYDLKGDQRKLATISPPPTGASKRAQAGTRGRLSGAATTTVSGRSAGIPMVGLGSFGSLQEARTVWAEAATGSSAKLQRIELVNGETLTYRPFLDGFASRAEAEAACQAYKAKGGACSLR